MITSRRIIVYRAKKLMDNSIFMVMVKKYCSVVAGPNYNNVSTCVLMLKCNS